MGMNFKVGLFNEPQLYWVIIAVIVMIAPLTLGIARQRDWI
jgi:Mg2+ and Co2+ transporter CorA